MPVRSPRGSQDSTPSSDPPWVANLCHPRRADRTGRALATSSWRPVLGRHPRANPRQGTRRRDRRHHGSDAAAPARAAGFELTERPRTRACITTRTPSRTGSVQPVHEHDRGMQARFAYDNRTAASHEDNRANSLGVSRRKSAGQRRTLHRARPPHAHAALRCPSRLASIRAICDASRVALRSEGPRALRDEHAGGPQRCAPAPALRGGRGGVRPGGKPHGP